MADWKEQLQLIQKLRLKRKQQDEQLHAVQIRMQKIITQLKKSGRQETSLPVDQGKLVQLQNKIARLEADLQPLNQELNNLDTTFEKIKELENNIDFLGKKNVTAKDELENLKRKLAEEEHNIEPNQKLIQQLQQQINELSELLPQLKKALNQAQKQRTVLNQKQEAALAEQKNIQDHKKNIQDQIDQLQAELGRLLNSQEPNNAGLEEKRKKLESEGNRIKKGLNESKATLHDVVGNLYVNPHPREALANLDDGIPFLLLPVRIETRFVTQEIPQLWVRIYPDEIAIHTHEKILTDKEVVEGEKYWTEIFDAEKANEANKEDRKKSAWSNLASIFGPQRSAWVALQTKPTNWSNDLSGIPTNADLVFPLNDLTKTNAWSRAPRTNVLPDKFVVTLYEGETVVKEISGNIIPDELFMGPDPMDATNAFQTKDDKLVFGDAYDWTSDFEKAVSFGMGFKIPITAQQAANGFDKILVLGVYLSANETASKEMVEDLFDNHHYSPNGFSLITQGTPTNNTDQNGSGYTKNDQFSNTSYFVETGEPLFTGNDDCDGRNLADALGIEYTSLQYILHSNATDHKEAVAMNKALYPATLGYYFTTMLHSVVGEVSQDVLRQFFTNHVTGRGPLPAIRVGDQPYGVLLTSDFGKWELEQHRLSFSNNSFFQTLLNLLRHYEEIWKGFLPSLNFVGKFKTDPSILLMDVLGLQAGSVEFFQRNAYSTEDLMNRDAFQSGKKYFNDLKNSFNSKNLLLGFFESFGFKPGDVKPNFTIPQLLRLVYQHYTATLDAANLIDDVPLSEEKLIRYYDEIARKNYLDWLAEATTPDILEKQNFGVGKSAPNALLYLMLRKALVEQLNNSSVKWLVNNSIQVEFTLQSRNFHNIRPEGDITKWEVMQAPVNAAVANHPQQNKSVAAHLLTTGINEDEAKFLNEVRGALQELSDLPTARLERCFTEHIDTCTYRLDAWQTALFRLRMQEQRQISGNGDRGQRRKEIYLGAYGWVENVRPSNKVQIANDVVSEKLRPKNQEPLFIYDDNGGFVHAPSLNHATAAAVLRSGYLSHANTGSPDIMSVNLSSERVRRALFILKGIQNGQKLEALLGYQFERGLHDRASEDNALLKLNSYIYNFRDAYPIELHQILQQGTNTVNESIPANNVVNGVTLAETTVSFPFGATGGVTTASSSEQVAIIQEKDRLADTLDAVKDLLLSESVYQLVLGNFDRAGAVMNALKDSHIPPTIDVINTPRSSHFTFTNRVAIQFENLDPNVAGSNLWPPIPMTQRAKMEPGMNKWLNTMLGKPTNLIFKVSHTNENNVELGNELMSVDKLFIQPIDLIYITGNELNTGVNEEGKEARTSVSELERRIAYYYRRNHGLDDAVTVHIQFLPAEDHPGKKTLGQMLPLFRMIKSLITDSRYLHAEDFDPTSKESISNPANPKGYDVSNMEGRVLIARTTFETYLNDLNNIAIQTKIKDEHGVVTMFLNLKDSFEALDKNKINFTDAVVTFSDGEASLLLQALIGISNFGVSDAFPGVASPVTNENKIALLEQARSVAKRATKAKVDSKTAFDNAVLLTNAEKKTLKLIESGKIVFGDVFNIIPFFTYNNEADIQQSHADELQLLKYATNDLNMTFPTDEWLQNVSHVRPKLMRWDYIRTLNETFGGSSLNLNPIQLPYRAKDSWVATEFPKTYKELDKDGNMVDKPFSISHDTLSVVINGNGAFIPAAKLSGLLIDDWTEIIPTSEEITGISFNYNQPNAMPPQALLLAVTPIVTGHWSWDNLIGILNDTLLRAKLRAVDSNALDTVNNPEISVLIPAILSNFTEYDLDISLDMRLNMKEFLTKAPVISVAGDK